MAQTTPIPTTALPVGPDVFTFPPSTAVYTNATITLDRTIAGGINSLTTSDTLQLAFDYSTDGGATWLNVGGDTIRCGTIVTKGVTLSTETLSIAGPQPFPVGTVFRVTTNASKAVEIAGSVVYS